MRKLFFWALAGYNMILSPVANLQQIFSNLEVVALNLIFPIRFFMKNQSKGGDSREES